MKINFSRIKLSSGFLLLCIALSFFLSLIFWIIKFPGTRRVFIFPSADSEKTCVESRYLLSEHGMDSIQYYVDELLLGPLSERCMPIFAKGTRVQSCFLRDSVLYVDLSPDLLNDNPESADFRKKFAMFRKNIMHNFNGINSVEVFVDSRRAFDND